MSKFCELIKNEFALIERYEMTDYLLEAFCCKIKWALKIKNTYFRHLKDFVNDRELFITALENLSAQHSLSVPDFGSSSETEKFFDFLIEVVKTVKAEKESEAKKEKLNRLKELKEELVELEREIYGC